MSANKRDAFKTAQDGVAMMMTMMMMMKINLYSLQCANYPRASVIRRWMFAPLKCMLRNEPHFDAIPMHAIMPISNESDPCDSLNKTDANGCEHVR